MVVQKLVLLLVPQQERFVLCCPPKWILFLFLLSVHVSTCDEVATCVTQLMQGQASHMWLNINNNVNIQIMYLYINSLNLCSEWQELIYHKNKMCCLYKNTFFLLWRLDKVTTYTVRWKGNSKKYTKNSFLRFCVNQGVFIDLFGQPNNIELQKKRKTTMASAQLSDFRYLVYFSRNRRWLNILKAKRI